MANENFDKLNNLRSDFAAYFEPMGISAEQKQKRVDLAFEWYELWLFFCAVYEEYLNNGVEPTSDALETAFKAETLDRLADYGVLDDEYLQDAINVAIGSIVKTTLNNPGVDYYTSDERGKFIAVDQSNDMENYIDYSEALKNCTEKTWYTMLDDKVRKTHLELDGVTIPIQGLFEVGGSFMRFPKDELYNPPDDEIINCRCWVTYR